MTSPAPLSTFALGVLQGIADKPCPRQEVNPGVVNKLCQEGLVEMISGKSPYPTRPGYVDFLHITSSGRFMLETSR